MKLFVVLLLFSALLFQVSIACDENFSLVGSIEFGSAKKEIYYRDLPKTWNVNDDHFNSLFIKSSNLSKSIPVELYLFKGKDKDKISRKISSTSIKGKDFFKIDDFDFSRDLVKGGFEKPLKFQVKYVQGDKLHCSQKVIFEVIK